MYIYARMEVTHFFIFMYTQPCMEVTFSSLCTYSRNTRPISLALRGSGAIGATFGRLRCNRWGASGAHFGNHRLWRL